MFEFNVNELAVAWRRMDARLFPLLTAKVPFFPFFARASEFKCCRQAEEALAH